MPVFAPRSRLERVAKAKKQEVDLWAEGVSHQQVTGRSLDELIDRATADRVALAARFASRARQLLSSNPPMFRDAISRAYYSMYHSWRAVAFHVTRGDDNWAHSDLPKFSPPGFPNVAAWQNQVKNARLTRNGADYDAYPKSDNAWNAQAQQLVVSATDLLSECKKYLRGRGCQYL